MNNALLSTMTIVPTYDQSHLLQSTIDALPELPLLYDSASCRYYVDGGTTQKRIGGEQLFDASRINSVAAGSTSIKNNGDGSFTIVGQGNITESLSSSYTFTHEESVKLFPIGAYTFQYYNVYPYHYMQVKINNTPVISMFSTATSPTLTVTEEWASDPTFQICIGFAGNMDSKIKPGVVRPMLCRVPLVDWQPYVGGIPAPNPEYPMACENTYPSGNYKFEVNGAWYKLALSDDLRSVDGIADRLWIEPRTGKAWVEKHVNVKNLVGTEAWVADTIASDTTKRYRLDGFNGWTDTSVCSHFSRIAADDDTIGYYGSEKSLYLKTDFASVGALKDFLLSKSGAGSPVTVLYELEKAVLCAVSISEIIVTEGSTIELEGTVNSCAEDFTIYGKTYQVETTGTQLFDAGTAKDGYYINDITGVESTTATQKDKFASDYISVSGIESITFNTKTAWGAWYDATKLYISGFGSSGAGRTLVIPENAAYMRFTGNIENKNVIMLNAGDTALPWEQYTGTQPSPSADYPQEVQGVGVRTAQLANLPDIAPTTSNGLTWGCKDGVITVTGTAQKNSDSTTVGLYAELHLQPGTYTVSGYDPDVEVYVRITRADDKTIYYQKSPFVAEATDKLTIIYAQVPTGKTVNKTIYPMLNAGTAALPFEPYGYKFDLVSKNNSKNLLNQQRMLDFILQKPGASIVQFDGRRCLKLDGAFNFPDFNLYEGFEPDKRYTLTFDGFYEKYKTEAHLSNGFAFTLQNGGRNLSLMDVSDIGTWKHKTTTSDTGVSKLTFTYGVSSVVYIDLDTIQLEEGTISTPYQPYAYYTAPIYTKEQVYQGDKIQLVDGQYCHVQNSMTVDGATVKWVEQATDVTPFEDSYYSHAAVPGVLSVRKYSNIKSTHFLKDETIKTTNANGTFLYNALLRVRLLGVTTLDAFKSWMIEHNPQFLLPRAEPKIEPLPSQQALNNLKTFQNYTYIVCQDRLHPEIEAKTKNLNRNLPLLYDTISNTTLKLETKLGRIKNFKLSGVTRQVETTGANLFGGKALTDKIMELAPTAVLDTANKTITYAASAIVEKVLFTGFEAGKQYTIILYGKNSNETMSPSNLSVIYGDNTSADLLFADVGKDSYCVFTTRSDKTPVSLRGIYGSQTTTLYYDKCGIFEGVIALEAFEPYTGTQSSPSPEYPQDIQGVGVRTAQMLDFTKVITYGWCALVDADTGTIKCDIVNDYYCILKITYLNDYIMAHKGGNLTFYADQPLDTWLSIIIDGTRSSGKTYQEATGKGKIVKATIADDFTSVRFMELRLNRKSSAFTDTDTVIPNIMLCEGTAVLPYEPYGYRTDVMTRTEQLFDGNLKNGFYNAGSGMQDTASTIYRTLEVEIKTAGKYTYSFEQDVVIVRDDGTVASASPVRNFTKEYTVGNHTLSIRKNPSSDWGEGMKIMLNYGATAKPYQPYAYYTAPIYTREPLTQWDHIEYRNGEYGVTRRGTTYTFTGQERFNKYGSNGFALTKPDMLPGNYRNDGYCNRFPCAKGTSATKGIWFGADNNQYIYFLDVLGVATSVSEFAAWLQANPTTIVYQLAEEVWEPLPAISQQALHNLPTYKGTTIIGTTDPLEPEITVSYRAQTDYSKLPGLEVDYEKCTTTRLGAAKNLTAGAQFNRFPMYGNRRRCNVLDDGTITACHGDPNYKEDGSNGQVMVYQPKFYYQVVPLKTDPQTDGIGYHLRRAQYWVSPKPQPGFKLHPAFINASGQEVDHILLSAYESSLYDTSAATYILDDAQVMDVEADKLCSISGARPASGSKQNFTRTAIEQLAQNRGPGWHGDLIKPVSAEQLLMIIEMGMMNLQTAIAQGVVSLPYAVGDDTTSSYAAATGSTSAIGNGTGRAETTTTYEGGVAKEYTVDGKTSVCWRGKENFWGNIYNLVYGINIWGNGKMRGGQPYICNDFNFSESKNNGNYEGAGFTVANTNGYISAMGYSTKYDWLFIASETLGNSSLPVSDYMYVTPDLNAYRITPLGGYWNGGIGAGAFFWSLNSGVGYRNRGIGGRLIYVPTDNLFNINRVFANPVPEAFRYYKYDLGLSPGSYRWSLQNNGFLGSGQYVLFTDDLKYEGAGVVSGKTYDWIGHSTRESYCHTSGSFVVKNEMYIAVHGGNVDAVKPLLKTLRIEKA